MKRKIAKFFAIAAVCYATTAFADLDSAIMAIHKQEYKKAFEEIEPDAKNGIPAAQVRLGELYEDGFGVNKSYDIALSWYEKAASQGNGHAMNKIANLYAQGYGVKEDMIIAIDWLRKSAEASNFIIALDNWLQTKDNRFKEKIAQAQEYFRRKAEQGDVIAQIDLGYMYFINLITPPDNQESLDYLEANKTQAQGWFQKAAEMGSPGAQKFLGFMNEFDSFSGSDKIQAKKWYELAANQGNADSQYMLAIYYLKDVVANGKSVLSNINKAKEWALKSAMQGYVQNGVQNFPGSWGKER